MATPHIVAALAWLVGWVLLTRVPRLGPARNDETEHDGAVTLVIPARNEAASLPHLLSDLEAVRPAGARVVLVDDHSDDGTAEVAERFDFVEVLTAPDLEDGWIGKTWACHSGAREAKPGVLVFLDADVRLHGDALQRAIATWRGNEGLVTVWPYHAIERPYEHLSALFNLTALMCVGCGSLVPARRPRGGFGPLMVTSTEAYASVGGHESVRHSVIDDFALVQRYGDAGLPVTNLGGKPGVAFRMYPGGLGSLVEGWTKNLGLGAGAAPFWRIAAIVFWLTCSIGSLTWVGGMPNRNGAILYGLYAIQMAVLLKQVGRFSVLDAIFYPLHVAFFVLVFASSLFQTHVLHRVRWRGRSIRPGASC